MCVLAVDLAGLVRRTSVNKCRQAWRGRAGLSVLRCGQSLYAKAEC